MLQCAAAYKCATEKLPISSDKPSSGRDSELEESIGVVFVSSEAAACLSSEMGLSHASTEAEASLPGLLVISR